MPPQRGGRLPGAAPAAERAAEPVDQGLVAQGEVLALLTSCSGGWGNVTVESTCLYQHLLQHLTGLFWQEHTPASWSAASGSDTLRSLAVTPCVSHASRWDLTCGGCRDCVSYQGNGCSAVQTAKSEPGPFCICLAVLRAVLLWQFTFVCCTFLQQNHRSRETFKERVTRCFAVAPRSKPCFRGRRCDALKYITQRIAPAAPQAGSGKITAAHIVPMPCAYFSFTH